MRKRAPLALATLQVLLGAALLYWDNIDTKQALEASGAASLPHYWSLAGGLLLDAAFLCAVFFLWLWIGFLYTRYRSVRGTTPAGPEMAVYLSLVVAFAFCILMGMQAGTTWTVLVGVFWCILALLIYLKRSAATKRPTA